jgi:hypothetical protein
MLALTFRKTHHIFNFPYDLHVEKASGILSMMVNKVILDTHINLLDSVHPLEKN